MEQHYACTGECKGVSDKPMVCGATDCSKYQKPLLSCDCKDGMHVPAIVSEGTETETAEEEDDAVDEADASAD